MDHHSNKRLRWLNEEGKRRAQKIARISEQNRSRDERASRRTSHKLLLQQQQQQQQQLQQEQREVEQQRRQRQRQQERWDSRVAAHEQDNFVRLQEWFERRIADVHRYIDERRLGLVDRPRNRRLLREMRAASELLPMRDLYPRVSRRATTLPTMHRDSSVFVVIPVPLSDDSDMEEEL